jgi:hypothetical protein
MADQLASPLNVIPFTAAEYLQQGEQSLMSMTDQERGEPRQWVVKACAEVLRDCATTDRPR